MPQYHTSSAVLYKLVRNDLNPKKFFLLVDAEDGNQYQVKLNSYNQRHNINEFIAHYLGSCSDMPLIEAKFIHLEDTEITKLKSLLSSLPKEALEDVDIDMMKKNLFFGIHWKKNLTKINNEGELMRRVNDTHNASSFFSLFTFDQYLKNYDRHIGNHLISQEKNIKKYHLIDFDRIFASTDWSNVPTFFTDFSPLLLKPYHAHLASLVCNRTIGHVHAYAGKIAKIQNIDIKDMCDMIAFIYDVPAKDIAGVYNWADHRKDQIVMKCFANEGQFVHVTKKGLYSVNR